MDQLPQILTKFENDEDKFTNYFNDLVAEYVLDRSRPYLQKYSEIESYAEVLEGQEFISELANLIVQYDLSTSKQLKKLVQKSQLKQLNEDKQMIILQSLFENIQTIKKSALERMISINTYSLVDYNWKLNIIMATEKLQQIKVPMLNVEFILKRRGEEQELRVNIEFTKEELASFLQKLKMVQQSMQNIGTDQQEN